MAITPDQRSTIRPLRGTFAALNANVVDIGEYEICYAIDTQQIYMKQGGSLVAVGANLGASTLTSLGDVEINTPQAGESLTFNDGYWKNGGIQDGGNF